MAYVHLGRYKVASAMNDQPMPEKERCDTYINIGHPLAAQRLPLEALIRVPNSCDLPR